MLFIFSQHLRWANFEPFLVLIQPHERLAIPDRGLYCLAQIVKILDFDSFSFDQCRDHRQLLASLRRQRLYCDNLSHRFGHRLWLPDVPVGYAVCQDFGEVPGVASGGEWLELSAAPALAVNCDRWSKFEVLGYSESA